MTVIELYKAHKDAKSELFAKFDTSGWEAIEDHTECKWHLDGGQSMVYVDKECEYSYDSCRQVGGTVDGVNLYYVYDNGDKLYVLFSVENEIEDWDEFEENL